MKPIWLLWENLVDLAVSQRPQLSRLQLKRAPMKSRHIGIKNRTIPSHQRWQTRSLPLPGICMTTVTPRTSWKASDLRGNWGSAHQYAYPPTSLVGLTRSGRHSLALYPFQPPFHSNRHLDTDARTPQTAYPGSSRSIGLSMIDPMLFDYSANRRRIKETFTYQM
jgi:hypothetical protein